MPSYHNTDEAAVAYIAQMLSTDHTMREALSAVQAELGLSYREATAAARAHLEAIGADCDATSDAIAASGGGPHHRRYWSVSSSSGAKSADPTHGTGEELEEFSDPLAGL